MSDSATPWIVTCPNPLSMGFYRQEYWGGLPSPPPGDLPNWGIEPKSPAASSLQVDSLLLSYQRSPLPSPTHHQCLRAGPCHLLPNELLPKPNTSLFPLLTNFLVYSCQSISQSQVLWPLSMMIADLKILWYMFSHSYENLYVYPERNYFFPSKNVSALVLRNDIDGKHHLFWDKTAWPGRISRGLRWPSRYSLTWSQPKHTMGVSLVVQWLKICLAMQGTEVRSLVWEDSTCCRTTKPMYPNYWAHALEPVSHNYWSPCTLDLVSMRGPRVQLEKALVQRWRLSAAKIK